MSGEQIVAIVMAVVGLIGGIGSAVKWSGRRITKSIETTAATTAELAKDLRRALDRNTDAMIANTASNAKLSTKINSVAKFVHLKTPAEGVPVTMRAATNQPAVEPDDGDD